MGELVRKRRRLGGPGAGTGPRGERPGAGTIQRRGQSPGAGSSMQLQDEDSRGGRDRDSRGQAGQQREWGDPIRGRGG
jgi:hypothetical protein